MIEHNHLDDLDQARINHEKMKSLLGNNAIVEEDIIPEEEEDRVISEEIDNTPPIHKEGEKIDYKLSDKSGLDFKEIKGKLSSLGVACIDGFISYINDMDPRKKMTPEEGVVHQRNFYFNISNMFNKLDDHDFEIVYKTLLLLFHHHRDDVFKEEAVYRYPEYWTMTEEERAAFRRLINLMIITRDPRTRRVAAREIKAWKHILAFGLTDAAKTRITNFYQD